MSLDAQTLVKRFRGTKLRSILDTLEAEHGVGLDDKFIESYRCSVEVLFRNELTACDGVEETLSRLDKAMCVASNGPMNKMLLALEVTGLGAYFGNNLFSAYQVKAWKPSPDLFLHAAKTMGFSPEECLVVEDSIIGIDAAISAGMEAVLYDPKNLHEDINGLLKVRHFTELL